jgi:hypothetical protein
MTFSEITGTIGVGLILLAFFASVFSLIAREGKLFFLLNIIGSALACYAALLIPFWPFVILEGAWCLVSVAGLFRTMKM